jgi:hypothetical protein
VVTDGGAGAETASDAPAVASAADESDLVIGSALRLAAKNRLILSVLREGRDWDEDAVIGSIRDELAALLTEKETELERLRKTRKKAGRRRGRATHADDFRRQDVPKLQAREAELLELIDALRGPLGDEAFLRRTADAARVSALDEMLEARLLPADLVVDDLDPVERMGRMADVREDIESLRRVRIAQGLIEP